MRTALSALVCLAASLQAQDPLQSKGFQHFYNLEYDQAIAEFEAEAARHPDAPDAYNHLAQTILYRAMFHAGALETELVSGNNPFLRRPKVNPTPADQKRFDEAIRKSIQISEALLSRNPRDTQAMYTAGVAYGLRANYNFLVKKAWRDALHDATTARRYHNKVTELSPRFIDARLVQGAHDYVVGSLPWHWKLLGFLVGFRGDKEEGIRTLELVAQKGKWNRADAAVLLAAVYRREKRSKQAIPLLESLIREFPRNFLLHFELAQMYADLGDKDRALAALDRVEQLKKTGTPGFAHLKAEKIYYSRGNIQFWYNDLDRALENMKKAAAQADELDLNTSVLAWMRLGQIYDLKGQRPQAVEAYKRAIALAPQSEAARESREYLSSPYRRRHG